MILEEKVMLYMDSIPKNAAEIAVIMDYSNAKCIAATLSKLHKKGLIKTKQIKPEKKKPVNYYYLEVV